MCSLGTFQIRQWWWPCWSPCCTAIVFRRLACHCLSKHVLPKAVSSNCVNLLLFMSWMIELINMSVERPFPVRFWCVENVFPFTVVSVCWDLWLCQGQWQSSVRVKKLPTGSYKYLWGLCVCVCVCRGGLLNCTGVEMRVPLKSLPTVSFDNKSKKRRRKIIGTFFPSELYLCSYNYHLA